eukprot:NODE_455_length_2452_cov_90.568484_g432_i0.p1 GENE.NODE_455_length_2452_cov_90.568484_g432_i0~~NODE_455_length_2452_cov_90.568484_g432_i0.p1  ORF type:complete len:455 (+),score=81.61 NODE_455_length_2452_cov_90.568484_g432_i0:678-2042(+)
MASGHEIIDLRPMDLAELAQGCGRLARLGYSSKGIKLDVEVDKLAKENLVMGDKARLEMVVNNFLSNARKFTPTGGTVQVKFAVKRVEADRLFVRASVHDTGVGISADDQTRLFRPYSQIRAGELQGGGGTGLGLCLSQLVVQAHGDKIGVVSDGATGSEFYFEIVFKIAPMAASMSLEANAAACPRITSFLSTVHFDDCAATVLIVDDGRVNRLLIRQLLSRIGVTSEEAEDGLQAVQLHEQGNVYQIVLMDKEMPNMDGYEATRRLREMGVASAIVGLTGNAMELQVHDFMEAGVEEVVAKPITLTRLKQLLGRYTDLPMQLSGSAGQLARSDSALTIVSSVDSTERRPSTSVASTPSISLSVEPLLRVKHSHSGELSPIRRSRDFPRATSLISISKSSCSPANSPRRRMTSSHELAAEFHRAATEPDVPTSLKSVNTEHVHVDIQDKRVSL